MEAERTNSGDSYWKKEEEQVIKIEDEEDLTSYYYCIVNNIPSNFHSSDLRNYFATSIEEGVFECFHFRHRPQFVCNPGNSGSNNNGESDLEALSEAGCSKNLEEEKTVKKLCAIVKFKDEGARTSFVKRHHQKFWMDSKGNDINQRCFVSRVKLDAGDVEKFSMELRPPGIMPQGNVGTRNSHFLELIRGCRLPPKLIRKLGIEFPNARKYKKYCKVPFNYKTKVVKTSEEEEEVLTGKGHAISDVFIDKSQFNPAPGSPTQNRSSKDESDESGPDDDDDRCEDWERHVAFEDDPTTQDRIKERLFEEEIELVWEKGGPGIVWYTDAQFWDEQRGGFDEKTSDNLDIDMQEYYTPGEGDKDAKDLMDIRKTKRRLAGIDDDTSLFKRPNPVPGKATKKLLSVGDNNASSSPVPTIGAFEKYTRGIGRKVMEKMGWKDGTGLGKSSVGITEALYNDGQRPSDKRGIGFYGDKIEYGTESKKKYHRKEEDYDDEHRVSIGTIYDNPKDLDQGEPVLRSNSISYIKRY